MGREVTVEDTAWGSCGAGTEGSPAIVSGPGSEYHPRGALTESGSCPYAGGSTGEVGAVHQGESVTVAAGGVSAPPEATSGGSTCGRGRTSGPRSARLMRIQSWSASKARNGNRMIRGSRSPCRRSLEPVRAGDSSGGVSRKMRH